MSEKIYNIISMMSGTSMDETDVCLVRLKKDFSFEIPCHCSVKYPEKLRVEVMKTALNKASVEEICKLNFLLGEFFSKCVNTLIKNFDIDRKSIDFISSHGQTVYHSPQISKLGGFKTGSTLQLGDISVIAFKTGIPVIGDFRAKDIAAGGQGAPLVPFADEKIFKREIPRCIQNIGGISNVTVLAPDYPTFAFDNAPGNMLIDFYTAKFFDKPFDKNSEFARQGNVDEKFFNALLSEKYYAKEPPKSTGRELFNDVYAEKMLKFSNGNKFDIVRTVTELTAKVIFDSYEKFIFPKIIPEQIVLGGGGAQNPLLKERLQSYCGKIPVLTHEDFDIDNKHKEALAFAMLGLASYLNLPGNVPSCTGASKPVVLGKISRPD